jgi:REP element-mobilizing transposase RayT
MNHKGHIIYAYVIMSNHMHLIVNAKDGYSLSGIIRDCKKFTSKAIVESMQNQPERRAFWLELIIRAHASVNHRNKEYQLWQQRNRAIELSDLRRLYQKLAYIHRNPVKAGIVTEPEHYLYSSARNYAGLQAILDITCLEIVPLDGYMRPM